MSKTTKTIQRKKPKKNQTANKSHLRTTAQILAELKKLGDYIKQAQPSLISAEIHHGELVLQAPAEGIEDFLKFLRDDGQTQFTQLMDLCGVDYPEREKRFDVVYHLLSMPRNLRVRVKIQASEDQPVHSVSMVYATANWFEREAFDLYGILFHAHPDLRRILTDYGFEGHPLRKDFPLTGFVEVRYDEKREAVIYEPVKLRQEFRNFDFLSPWEGIDKPEEDVLPGATLTDKPSVKVVEESEPQFADPEKDYDSRVS